MMFELTRVENKIKAIIGTDIEGSDSSGFIAPQRLLGRGKTYNPKHNRPKKGNHWKPEN